jgi:hypothetical protein
MEIEHHVTVPPSKTAHLVRLTGVDSADLPADDGEHPGGAHVSLW